MARSTVEYSKIPGMCASMYVDTAPCQMTLCCIAAKVEPGSTSLLDNPFAVAHQCTVPISSLDYFIFTFCASIISFCSFSFSISSLSPFIPPFPHLLSFPPPFPLSCPICFSTFPSISCFFLLSVCSFLIHCFLSYCPLFLL